MSNTFLRDGEQQLSELQKEQIKKNLGLDNLVGKKANSDGEIFNDYEGNVASGNYSHAEGMLTSAIGEASHTEGSDVYAYGDASHAEGCNTYAYVDYSHTEGCNTYAYGEKSHAEGYFTSADGEASHSEGKDTQATGNYSHAGGLGTIASAEAQTVIGKYNQEVSDALFVIGNGDTNGARNNAFTVDKDGNVKVSGNLQSEGADFNNTVAFHDDVTMDNPLEIRSFATVDEVIDGYEGKSVVNVEYLNAQLNALITVADIDTICGGNIVAASEVTF